MGSDSESIMWFLLGVGAGAAMGVVGALLTFDVGGGTVTEFVRDDQGRIIEIMERGLD